MNYTRRLRIFFVIFGLTRVNKLCVTNVLKLFSESDFTLVETRVFISSSFFSSFFFFKMLALTYHAVSHNWCT